MSNSNLEVSKANTVSEMSEASETSRANAVRELNDLMAEPSAKHVTKFRLDEINEIKDYFNLNNINKYKKNNN